MTDTSVEGVWESDTRCSENRNPTVLKNITKYINNFIRNTKTFHAKNDAVSRDRVKSFADIKLGEENRRLTEVRDVNQGFAHGMSILVVETRCKANVESVEQMVLVDEHV